MTDKLDLPTAAAYCGIGVTAFRRVVRSGAIHYTITTRGGWRFTVADLDDYLETYARIRPGELEHLVEGLRQRGSRYVQPRRAPAPPPDREPPPEPRPKPPPPLGLQATLPPRQGRR